MTDTVLELCNVKTYFHLDKHRTVHAVDGIDLKIKQGEVLGLVGESGSGKSTLGKAIVGLHPKTSGSALFNGQQLPANYKTADYKKYGKSLQMIFQDPYSSLNPHMNVFDILREPLLLQGENKSKNHDKALIISWLEKVGLQADHLSRYPHEFSGGQRQRLGIARALIINPHFIVCDEPISALDVSVQAQVINLLTELKQSMDLTLLFIAHDLSMVRYISDRIMVMYMGIMVEMGAADDVFFNPQHPYTQMLIASNPVADPKKERAREDQCINGEVASPINIKPGCRFYRRCPHAFSPCEHITPQIITTDKRQVACHLYDPTYQHEKT